MGDKRNRQVHSHKPVGTFKEPFLRNLYHKTVKL